MLFTADAHRDNGKRFIATADEKLTAFLEVESHLSKEAERQSVERCSVFLEKDQAINYAQNRASFRSGEIRAAYEEAIQRKYLWHEFGDLNLSL